MSRDRANTIFQQLVSDSKKSPIIPIRNFKEKDYLELNCSRFEFLAEVIDEQWFESDSIKYLKECKKYYDYKEKQRPIIEANKEFEKKKEAQRIDTLLYELRHFKNRIANDYIRNH